MFSHSYTDLEKTSADLYLPCDVYCMKDYSARDSKLTVIWNLFRVTWIFSKFILIYRNKLFYTLFLLDTHIYMQIYIWTTYKYNLCLGLDVMLTAVCVNNDWYLMLYNAQ